MKNWKTTLAGILAAAATGAAGYVSSGGNLNWQTVATAAGMAALGYLSKDAGMTGTEK